MEVSADLEFLAGSLGPLEREPGAWGVGDGILGMARVGLWSPTNMGVCLHPLYPTSVTLLSFVRFCEW